MQGLVRTVKVLKHPKGKSPNWYLRFWELTTDGNGWKEKWRSTKTKLKKEAEQQLRQLEHELGPVVGRKAWLFVGSPTAGERAAILMSLIASCKANHVESWAWLRDVLRNLPKGTALESLLPDVWLQHNPQHRWIIAQRRKDER